MAKTWIMSDNHYFHYNIIGYCNRHPAERFALFADEFEMNEYMVNAHNEVVGKNDEVIHAGDFAFCKYFDTLKALFDRLNGRITLILGNHDTHNKLTKDRLYKLGFKDIITDRLKIRDNVYVSHKPLLLGPDVFNLHGHIHDKEATAPNQFNVSVERNNYRPFLLQDVLNNHVTPYFNKRKESPNA